MPVVVPTVAGSTTFVGADCSGAAGEELLRWSGLFAAAPGENQASTTPDAWQRMRTTDDNPCGLTHKTLDYKTAEIVMHLSSFVRRARNEGCGRFKFKKIDDRPKIFSQLWRDGGDGQSLCARGIPSSMGTGPRVFLTERSRSHDCGTSPRHNAG